MKVLQPVPVRVLASRIIPSVDPGLAAAFNAPLAGVLFSLEELREICPAFDEDIYEAISMDTCVNKRLTIGAPGKEAMEKVIAIYRNDLSESDEI